jgi:hypothetical protein
MSNQSIWKAIEDYIEDNNDLFNSNCGIAITNIERQTYKELFEKYKPTKYSKTRRFLIIHFEYYAKMYIPFWWHIDTYIDDIIPKHLKHTILVLLSRKTQRCRNQPFIEIKIKNE